MEPEVLFDVADGIGTITLNRPRTLNALTMNMIAEMRTHFTAWMADDAVKAVVIKGAGDRAFCAGGDVRAVRQSIIDHDGDANSELAQDFFYEEYILNHQIHTSPKPYIALIDRVCMGGGVGLSVHGSFRVATERTRVGMPETTIGLFPDVGGAWFLSRLPGEAGTYLALTGVPVTVGDCERLGISTHVVDSEKMEEIEAKLHGADLSGDAHAAVKAVLDGYVIDAGEAPTADARGEIDAYFAGDDVEVMVERLEASSTDFAAHALETLGSKSPSSLKVTLEQIRRGGRATTFAETMTMEYRMSQHFARGHDFPEGVRALLVDKDHKPNWSPSRLEDVSDAAVAGYFEPVPWRELTFD
jgi:enoyl-CoA hydratase